MLIHFANRADRLGFALFLLLICSILIGGAGCRAAKLRKKTADELVIDLQKGALLVRLQTAERKAETLRHLGKAEEAEAVLSRQAAFNEEIRAAFDAHYDFSPVFFFEAPDSRFIRERRFQELLTDVQGQVIAEDPVGEQPFLVAEFGEIQSPAPNAGLDALYLMDDQLRPLMAPFPYAVPTHLFLEEEVAARAVARLNLKLNEFHARALFRERKRELRGLR